MARQGGGPLPYYGIRRRTTSESSSPSLSSGKSQKAAFNDRYVLGEELGRGAFGQVSSLILQCRALCMAPVLMACQNTLIALLWLCGCTFLFIQLACKECSPCPVCLTLH